MMIFAENMKRVRKEKKMTQECLSERTGIHQTQLSHYENNDRKPSFENLILISKALRCTIDELVK